MKTITILCSIQFDVADNANAEEAKYDAVDLINDTLRQSELNCQPQILNAESMIVTAIEPVIEGQDRKSYSDDQDRDNYTT